MSIEDFFGYSRFFGPRGNQRAHELADEWRGEYYRADGAMNKAQRAVELHPEKYVMGFTITPDAIYQHQLAKFKYELGLELKKILKSEPKPKELTEPTLNAEDIRRAVKKLKGEKQ